MAEAAFDVVLQMSPEGEPSVTVGGQTVASLAALGALGLDLSDPDSLMRYCEAANHLAYGYDYRIIRDPDAYRADYDARFAAEDPAAPWREGAPQLHDFGRSDTSAITLPRLEGDHVVAFVENDFLRIPYRATFPLGGAAG